MEQRAGNSHSGGFMGEEGGKGGRRRGMRSDRGGGGVVFRRAWRERHRQCMVVPQVPCGSGSRLGHTAPRRHTTLPQGLPPLRWTANHPAPIQFPGRHVMSRRLSPSSLPHLPCERSGAPEWFCPNPNAPDSARQWPRPKMRGPTSRAYQTPASRLPAGARNRPLACGAGPYAESYEASRANAHTPSARGLPRPVSPPASCLTFRFPPPLIPPRRTPPAIPLTV